MSAINVTQVSVLGNPAPYTHPFQFEISYECLYALQDGETRNKKRRMERPRGSERKKRTGEKGIWMGIDARAWDGNEGETTDEETSGSNVFAGK